MDLEKIIAVTVSGLASALATCIDHLPNILKQREECNRLMAEATKAIGELINSETPPSFATIFKKNIPTAMMFSMMSPRQDPLPFALILSFAEYSHYQEKIALFMNDCLDYNEGAARKATVIYEGLASDFLRDLGKKMASSLAATAVGTIAGTFIAKHVVDNSQKDWGKSKIQQNRVASLCGAIISGGISFALTRSAGLSLANAGISALAPFCFPK